MPTLISLTQNFDGHDSSKWAKSANCTISGGSLSVTPTVGYGSYYGFSNYDMTGKCVMVQVVSAPTNPTSPGSAEGILGIDNAGGDSWQYKFKGDSSIIPAEKVSGVTTNGTTMAWSGAIWLRIQEASGTVYFEYSYDCITWTTQWSKSWAVSDITVMHPYLMAGYFAGSPSGTATYDNFNLPSPLVGTPWFSF